ncbi:MAG: sigma-70 family RNA polymerase sigma factor [Acidobacteriota bacterium]
MSALLAEEGDDVLRRAQSGDGDAFAVLVGDHESMVFSIAWYFFGDRNRGEEIAQDVFLQLYRNLDKIETRAHLVFWLRQVTSRRCIDEVRRAGPRRISLDDAGDLPVASAAASDPLAARRLRQMIAALPQRQRIIITLRYQEDLDPSDIGRIVGMPVNTIKSHLHRAILALRKKMGV